MLYCCTSNILTFLTSSSFRVLGMGIFNFSTHISILECKELKIFLKIWIHFRLWEGHLLLERADWFSFWKSWRRYLAWSSPSCVCCNIYNGRKWGSWWRVRSIIMFTTNDLHSRHVLASAFPYWLPNTWQWHSYTSLSYRIETTIYTEYIIHRVYIHIYIIEILYIY